MIIRFRAVAAIGVAMFGASAAGATVYTATEATLAATWKAVKAGDTIALSGTFGLTRLQYASFARPVTLDARGAVFTDTLVIKNVDNLNVVGGRYGSATQAMTYGKAIIVAGGSKIGFTKPTVTGNFGGQGINFDGTSGAAVNYGTFTGLWVGVAFNSVTGGWAKGNYVTKSVADGFDIDDSHNVKVSGTTCSGGSPAAGAHPDCIQLWSTAGHAVQSDITLTHNTAIGATQGFTSFSPEKGGGLRISMTYNTVNTSYPQGIACYACVDSEFLYNTLTTLPGATYMTNMNIIGGSNNTILGNTIGPKPRAAAVASRFAAIAAFDGDSDAASATGAVPEPSAWLLLIAGFGVVGGAARRARYAAAA